MPRPSQIAPRLSTDKVDTPSDSRYPRAMTLDDVCDALVSACAKAGGREAWGRQHGFTRAIVSSVLLRKRAPSVRLLAALGLERVVTTTVSYRKATTPRRKA